MTCTEVRVEGRRAWLPEDAVDTLRAAPAPRLVRLLPPSDPWLQARDRDLIVPDKERRSAVWRILGNPGALLVNGEIEGVWRPKAAGRRRLGITITPFSRPTSPTRKAVEAEAERIATTRGATEVRVRFEE